MDCKCPKTCLVLSKSHWEYLSNKADSSRNLQAEESLEAQKKREYYKALDENSQEWRKNWPSSVEGIRARQEARKKRQVEKDIAFMKMYNGKEKKSQANKLKTIAEAKQIIFDTTCYGVELLSALRQSKTIEEREAQIEFNKLLKQKEKENEKELDDRIAAIYDNQYEFGSKNERAKAKSKKIQAELAIYNKLEHERKLQKESEEKEQQRLGELEDTRLQHLNLEYEKHEMDHCKAKALEEIKEYALAQNMHRKGKQLRDQEDNELIAISQKHFDRVRKTGKATCQRIINAQGEKSDKNKKVYKMLKTIQEHNQKAYDDFVQKRIDELEARVSKKEHEDKVKEVKLDKDHFKQVLEDYKAALEVKDIMKHCNKCACERQTWISKPRERTIKNVIGGDEGDTFKPESFLKPNTKLSDALKKRKNELTPWTALKGQHKEFAEQATATLNECKYKHLARKVVDSPREFWGHINHIIQEALGIPKSGLKQLLTLRITRKHTSWILQHYLFANTNEKEPSPGANSSDKFQVVLK